MFFSKKLKKFKDVKHCFFSRNGGFSRGIYQGLNCGRGSKDNKRIVDKNDQTTNKIKHLFKSGIIKSLYLKNSKYHK